MSQLTLQLPSGNETNKIPGLLKMATVWNRYGVTVKKARGHLTPLIALYVDSPTERVVRELRLYPAGGGRLETKRLFDFDSDMQTWRESGPSDYQDIESEREAVSLAKSMLAEIQQAGLRPSRHNNGSMESFFG